jgi:hypothetical protein
MLKKRGNPSAIEAVQQCMPKGVKDHALFVCLMQRVGAKDILRRFATGAAENLTKQARKVHDLKKTCECAAAQIRTVD